MPSSEILPFATTGTPNVVSQSTWAASSVLANGFQTGICPSAYYNKGLRQSSFMASGLAAWMVSKGYSVPDDGNLTNLTNNLIAALAPAAATFTPTSTDTLTNKTISGSSNTITNVSLTAGITGTLAVSHGGTGLTSLGSANQYLAVNGAGTALVYVNRTGGATFYNTRPGSPVAGDTVIYAPADADHIVVTGAGDGVSTLTLTEIWSGSAWVGIISEQVGGGGGG